VKRGTHRVVTPGASESSVKVTAVTGLSLTTV
jgi:hypothetical protein